MKILDLTLPTPEENLACDEALLDHCEDGGAEEILRFWEPLQHFVVLGYSNKRRDEINELSCAEERIPVFRRPSGGGTVLQGPGCLNYSLVLRIPSDGPLTSLTGTNCHVMSRNRKALAPLLPGVPVEVRGTSDLCAGDVKVSGNAQRRKRSHLLFHGTFLLNMDLKKLARCLAMPPREPDYRRGRAHLEFVRNLGLGAGEVKAALSREWDAREAFDAGLVAGRVRTLVAERYSRPAWNEKF